jgi:glycosyltransferase involved in cell wall biosynthesis
MVSSSGVPVGYPTTVAERLAEELMWNAVASGERVNPNSNFSQKLDAVQPHHARPRLLMIGAFPSPSSTAVGGQITACGLLRKGHFADNFEIRVIDSTQSSNPPAALPFRACRAIGRVLACVWELSFRRPDVVLIFATVGASYVEKGCMSLLCEALRVRRALFLRGGELIDVFQRSWLQRGLMRALLRRASLFLCQGPSWQKFAVDKLNYPIDRCPIIPNWTATEDLLLIGRGRSERRHTSQPRFLFTGWLEREKGIEELLLATRTLRDEGLDFRLTLVGDGHCMPWVTQFVQANSLQQHVVISGWQSPKEIRRTLSDHDIFVLPSWAEGMSNSLIEAMAARLARRAGVADYTTPTSLPCRGHANADTEPST